MKATNYLLGIFTFSWSLPTSATSFSHHGLTDEILAKETKIDATIYPVVNEEKIESDKNMNRSGKRNLIIFLQRRN